MNLYANSDVLLGSTKLNPATSEDFKEVIEKQLTLIIQGHNPVEPLQTINSTIHRSCVKAGWWHELGTETLKPRNFGELMALIMSEMMEGFTAEQDEMDDKLPQYDMDAVEIGDTFIRLADLGGAVKGPLADQWQNAFATTLEENLIEVGWEDLFKTWLQAFETGRKGQNFYAILGKLQAQTLLLGEVFYPGLMAQIIAEKWYFNQSRLDHQIANRQQPGNKAI